MSWDVYIEIFGKIESAEALSDLAKAAAVQGGTDWTASLEGADDAAAVILAAAGEGDSFALMCNEATSLFKEVTAACRAHGLSYVLHAGECGGEGYDHMESWEPGMADPYEGPYDGNDPMVGLTDLKEAMQKGIDIRGLVEDLERRTLAYVTERRIEVAPEVRPELMASAPKA
ncbi:MAG: hypothetical protein EOR63_32295 [Mesorhizobium sp.]|nr:MAG: hypothetical protein EOR63_32295 [Mesorhizobium sp.]